MTAPAGAKILQMGSAISQWRGSATAMTGPAPVTSMPGLSPGNADASSVTDHELQEGALLRQGIFPPTPGLTGELTENRTAESSHDGRESKAKLHPGEVAVGPRGMRFRVAWEETKGSPELRTVDRIRDFHVEFLLRALHEDRLSGNPAGPAYQELLLLALASLLLAKFSCFPVRQRRYKTGLPTCVLRRLTEYIDQH